MLPILKAVAIEKSSMPGGSTLPSLMTVKGENGVFYPPYVVKIFKADYLGATCREIWANILASEFDLQVPKAALVEVNHKIIRELKLSPKFKNRNIRAGYYFGTEFLSEAHIYTINSDFEQISDSDMIRIFAFDVLIRNADRRIGKPNLLIHKGDPILIDHELSLVFGNKIYHDFDVDDWGFLNGGSNMNHIFLEILREKYKNNLIDLSILLDHLRALNPDILKKCVLLLTHNVLDFEGNDTKNVLKISDYLNIVKNNPNIFIQFLKKLLI
jgi:hypothetical protein